MSSRAARHCAGADKVATGVFQGQAGVEQSRTSKGFLEFGRGWIPAVALHGRMLSPFSWPDMLPDSHQQNSCKGSDQ